MLLDAAPTPWLPEHRLRGNIGFLGRILGPRAPPAALPINCAEKTAQKCAYARELCWCLFPQLFHAIFVFA